MLTRQLYGRATRNNDLDEKKYTFVIALFDKENQLFRHRCTGTLISPNWVITAASCLFIESEVQFDELDLPINETNSIRRVLHTQRPPAGSGSGPDLGLMFVNAIPMKDYGQLAAVDYKAIAGHIVTFAGYELMKRNCSKCVVGSIVTGEGVLFTCNAEEKKNTILFAPTPSLCVAPKCSESMWKNKRMGEPGSPVFHNGKLVGVHMGGVKPGSLRTYTPISPYLGWIQRAVTKPELLRSGVGSYNYPDRL